MTIAELKQQVLDLPERERLEVAEAVWTSLPDPDLLPLPEWQRALLEERLATAATEPGRDWDEVKAALWPEPE